MSYTQDYSQLIVTSDDLQISLFDLTTQKHVSLMSGHTNTINGLTANPLNPSEFATCASDKTMKFWDLRSKSCISTMDSAHGDVMWCCKYAPNGGYIYTGSETGYFIVYSL